MPVQASDIRLANLISLEKVQAQTDQLTRAASSLSWPEAAGAEAGHTRARQDTV